MKQDRKVIITTLDEISRLVKECNELLSEQIESIKPQTKQITLEEVRAVLAEKSQDGFTSEVRGLLEKYGAKRLSEIDPSNYKALKEDAEELQ